MRKTEISIASDFTSMPGARYRSDGPKSGEEFREEILAPAFERARASGASLEIDLDGTEGYATSFLEEAFGGLARNYGPETVIGVLRFTSAEEPSLIDEILSYIREAQDMRKR